MYVKIKNGAVNTYPYSLKQLRQDNPNVSFPRPIPDEMLSEYGVYPVAFADEPTITERTQNVDQNASPSLVDGVWTVGYTTSNKSQDEIDDYDEAIASSNRAKRDELLLETDRYGLSDMTMTAEMTTYRQALRDLPTHANWPSLGDDDWPVKP